MRTSLLFTAVLLAACGLARAGTPIDQTRPLDAHGKIQISNVSGEVNVTGWDKPEVHITGTLGEGAQPLKIEGNDHSLSIKVEARDSKDGWFNWGNDSHMKPTRLNVQVPVAADVSVEVVSANARLEKLDGGKVDVDAVSGQVKVDAVSPEVSIDSVSGDITLSGKATRLDIDTVSGDVRAPTVGSHGKLESVSGDIHVAGGPFQQINASTVSGDLDVQGGLADSGSMQIETMSGDLTLTLPGATSARLDASTFSGDINSALGEVSHREHGPGGELKATLGEGGGDISLETFSGDIVIKVGN